MKETCSYCGVIRAVDTPIICSITTASGFGAHNWVGNRVPWDTYFLDIAKNVAARATCPRKRVGAVIVSPDKYILATGYNGSTPGAPHCDDVGCMMEDNHCVRTVHAEGNAIAQAARHGVAIRDATIYTTANPCWPCFKLLVNAGIQRMCFGEFYRPHEHDRVLRAAQEAGVELVDLTLKTAAP